MANVAHAVGLVFVGVSVVGTAAGADKRCEVDPVALKTRGSFVYNSSLQAAYDYKCWLYKARYHIAPACEHTPRLWQFQWELKGCPQRDLLAQVSPLTFLPEKRTTRLDRPFTVIFYGHSFMRQLFESAACQYAHLVSGGSFDGMEPPRTLDQIRAGGGTCPGYCNKDLQEKFPPGTHNGEHYVPKQNFDCCHDSGACILYSDPNDPSRTVRFCYQYQFSSSFPAIRQMKSVDDADVVVSTARPKAVLRALSKAYGWGRLPRVIMLGPIQAIANSQLISAMKQKATGPFDPNFVQAQPQSCSKRDIHFAMPGVPDFSLQFIFLLEHGGGGSGVILEGDEVDPAMEALAALGPVENITPTGIGTSRHRR